MEPKPPRVGVAEPTQIETPAMSRREKRPSFIPGLITGLLGSAAGVLFLAFGFLALPLNVLAVMHLTGWSWFGALIGSILFSCIPIFGQLGFPVLAVMGGYYLWAANFDWQEAAYPTVKTFSVSTLSASDLERFKSEVLRPGFEKECKSDALKIVGFDGKLPANLATRCECIAENAVAIIDRDDLIAYEKLGQYPAETQARLKDQLRRACTTISH
jgi:hypothetical protein